MSDHDLSEDVLAAAVERGSSLVVSDLLLLVERYEGAGVPRERLLAYADEIGGVERETVEVGGEISSFPSLWHALDGESDLTVYVATINADADGEGFAEGGQGDGVPETVLVDAATVFGPYDAEAVREEIFQRRQDGELAADADQSPQAKVQLPENADPEVRREAGRSEE